MLVQPAAGRKPVRRGRKVATAVVCGLLAVTALSACRTDAGSAAFVGPTRITQDQVSSVESQIPAAILQASGGTSDADARQFVLSYQTMLALMKQYAKDNKLGTPSSSDTAQALAAEGQSLGINATDLPKNQFAKLVTDVALWVNYLEAKTPQRAGTDADYRALFNELVMAGTIPAGTTYAQVKPVFQQEAPQLGGILDLQKELNNAAKDYGVSINPRYIPSCSKQNCSGLEFALLRVNDQQNQISFDGAYVKLGGDASPAVLDVPTPVVTQAAAAQQ